MPGLPLDQRELGCGGTQPLPGRREKEGVGRGRPERALPCTVSDGRIDGHLSVDGLGLREPRSPFSSPLSSRLKGIDFALETFPEPFLWSPIANWGSGTSCSFLLPFILQVIARKNILDAERDHQSLLGHLPVALAWKHLLAT